MQPLEQGETIAVRKPQIEENDVRRIALNDGVGLGEPAGCAHAKSGIFQEDTRRARDERIVLDEEYVWRVGRHSVLEG